MISLSANKHASVLEVGTERADNERAVEKYQAGGSKLVRSSNDLGWRSAVTAGIYRHAMLDCLDFVQPITEVVIGMAGNARFRRKADGPEQSFVSGAGSVGICPRGIPVKYLHIDAGPVEMLHISMPASLFGALRSADGSDADSGLIYAGGLHDPLIQSIGSAINEELAREATPDRTDRIIVDSFAMGLAARLLQRYTRGDRRNFTESYIDARSSKGLDPARLDRVTDFIQHRFDADISLDDLADVACLSVFHFCRAFKIATGLSPFQYISGVRIRRAQQLLTDCEATIDDIASSTGFSSGANLARAFKKSVGLSPSQYRAQRPS